MFTGKEALLIAFLWAAAGFLYGWMWRRKEIDKLRMEMADKQTAWEMERIIWSRHK